MWESLNRWPSFHVACRDALVMGSLRHGAVQMYHVCVITGRGDTRTLPTTYGRMQIGVDDV